MSSNVTTTKGGKIMSCVLVDTKVIDTIVNTLGAPLPLVYDPYSFGKLQYKLVKATSYMPEDISLFKYVWERKDAAKVAKAMVALNHKAYLTRYGEDGEANAAELLLRYKGYTLAYAPSVSLVQLAKYLDFFLYQANESWAIENSRLYKALATTLIEVHRLIVTHSPEYKAAAHDHVPASIGIQGIVEV